MASGAARATYYAGEKIRQTLPVIVFFQDALPETDAQNVFDSIKAGDVEIEQARFTSATDAAEEARKDPILSRSIMLLNTNPFPSSGEFILSMRAWLSGNDLSQRWSQTAGSNIRWDRSRQSALLLLHQMAQRADLLLWSASGATLLWAVTGFYAFARHGMHWRGFLPHVFWGAVGGAMAAAIYWGLRLNFSPDTVLYWAGSFPILPILLGSLASAGLYRGHV